MNPITQALFVLLFSAPSGKAVDGAALDAALAAFKSSAPSVVAAVVKDGKTVWIGGKGANRDTVFRIASLTKAFTATTILQLANEGKLVLDAPVAKTLPELPTAWKGVTIRQLLNHTSGIPDYTSQASFWARLGERLTPAGIVARTADKPLDFPPGSRFAYDNTGYVILGMVVERLDKVSFAESLQRRILKPLGMRHTRLNTGGDVAEALGFDAQGKPAVAISMSQPYSAGSMVSTADDLTKWLAAQGSPRLLPAWCWAEMWKPGILTDGKATNYGFAWFFGRTGEFSTVGHSGGIPGFSSYLRIVPSKCLAALTLANAEDVATIGLPGRLLEIADPTLGLSTVADPDPKLTEAALKLLRQFEQGAPDKGAMAPDFAAQNTPELIAQQKYRLTHYGEFRDLRLVAVDGPKRTYVVRYEKLSLTLSADIDGEGRFTRFNLEAA